MSDKKDNVTAAGKTAFMPVMPKGMKAQVPNAITCVVVASGFLLMISASLPGYTPKIGLVVFIGLIADIAGGALARYLNVGTQFGSVFDELADLTAFGIGPSVFFMRHCMDSANWYMTGLAGYAYMLAAVFRISRELVVHRGHRPLFFVGITTNHASSILAVVMFFFPDAQWLPALVFFLSVMMAAPVKILKDLTGLFISYEEQYKSMAESKPSQYDGTKPVMPQGFLAQIPNLITCLVVASGWVLMISASLPDYTPKIGLIVVFIGLLADIADGAMARYLDVGTKFGSYFDELADLTAFGIGPAVFFMRHFMGNANWQLTCLAGYAYMLAAVFRISRELVVHRGHRPLFFVGITTNHASALLVVAMYFFPSASWMPLFVLALSFLMVAPVKILKDFTGLCITFEEQFKSMAAADSVDITG